MYLGNFKSTLVQTYRELSEADDSSLDDSNQRVLKHSDQKRLDGVCREVRFGIAGRADGGCGYRKIGGVEKAA